jgi:hypothetical protein
MRNGEFYLVKLLFVLLALAQVLGVFCGITLSEIIDLELLAGMGVVFIVLLTIESVIHITGSSMLRGLGSNFALGITYGEVYHLSFSPSVETDLGFFALTFAFCYVLLATWFLVREIDLYFDPACQQPDVIIQAWAGTFLLPLLVLKIILAVESTLRLQNARVSNALRVAFSVFHLNSR